MNRLACTFFMVLLAAFVLGGCGGESSPAEREGQRKSASERGSSPEIEPKQVGEVAEVGPFSVTLNGAKPYSSKEDDGAASQTHYYAVTDLTLENRGQDSFDASSVDYLLRDKEGYSFEKEALPDQKPSPEGQITPGGKASGQVAFDLGTKPVGAPLTLFVSLPEVEGASQVAFEFEVEHKTQKKSKPAENSREGEEAESESTIDYRMFADDTGALSVEIPSGWEVVNDKEVAVKALNSQGDVVAREGTDTAISAAPSIDSWESTEGAGTSIIVVKDLAQRFTDDQLIDSVPALNSFSLNCATGEREDLDRPAYSGRVQAWSGCDLGVPTYYTMSASPEGRGCAVIAQIGLADEADKDTAKRILDTFEVDCERAVSEPLATSSASASPEAPASPEATPSTEVTSSPEESAPPAPGPPEPEAGTKHVEVVVSSDVPVDVSITDDNFDVSIGEEITGTKTYEFDIAADSGLLVSAMNPDLRGNVSIEVYENGQLKTQDTDSSGWAQISY